MPKKRGFLLTYLVLAIFVGVLSLVDSILAFLEITSNIFLIFLSIILIMFFFLSIVAIALFHHHRIERLAYVLPVYYIISYLVFFGIGALITLKQIDSSAVFISLTIIGLLASFFEIGFSIHVIRKLELIKAVESTTIHTHHWEPPKFS